MAKSTWNDCLYKSLDKATTDEAIIKRHLAGCVKVVKADAEMDKRGIDYIAYIGSVEHGAKVYVDVKRRERGAIRYWKDGVPEIALESWSVLRSDGYKKAGWTLNTETEVDYILFLFGDLPGQGFLAPFQILRKAYLAHTAEWNRAYPPRTQTTIAADGSSWKSEVQFIPVSVLVNAMTKASCFIEYEGGANE